MTLIPSGKSIFVFLLLVCVKGNLHGKFCKARVNHCSSLLSIHIRFNTDKKSYFLRQIVLFLIFTCLFHFPHYLFKQYRSIVYPFDGNAEMLTAVIPNDRIVVYVSE